MNSLHIVITHHDLATAAVSDTCMSRINGLPAFKSPRENEHDSMAGLHHGAIKKSYFKKIMEPKSSETWLLTDVFTSRRWATLIIRRRTLKATVTLFVSYIFFLSSPKDLFEIIVEQPRQLFFLLLKHAHVNIIFYLYCLKSVPRRRHGFLRQSSKKKNK